MKITSNMTRIIAIAFASLFLIVSAVFFSTSTQSLQTNDVNHLNDGWNVYVNGDMIETGLFPTDIVANANDNVMLTRTLNSSFANQQTLLIRGSLQNVKVELDDELIYQKSFEDNIFGTYASLFHFIEIPDQSDGKTLEITLISPFNDFSGTINDIFYGSPSSIETHLLSTYGPKLIIGLVWFIISVFMFAFSWLFFNKNQRYYNYIAIFGMFMSLWLINESRILQLLINNDFLIGSMSYVAIAVAPIAMLAFFKSDILKSDKNILNVLSAIFVLNLFLIIVLHMFGLFAFFDSATITNIINIIAIGFLLYRLIYYYIKTKDIKYIRYFIVFGIFSTFLALEIISFLLKDFDSISIYASTGMVVEFFIVLFITLMQIMKRNRLLFKEKLYQEIAYTDQLTKAKSRFAFENDMDDLFYDTEKSLVIIYFDFDDLKYINDHFGHIKGDDLLIKGYHLIKEVFNQYGETYRIGGDEFACLATDLSISKLNELKNLFKKRIMALSDDLEYHTIISLGYAIKDLNIDEKPSDLIHRADEAMYKDKNKNKTQDK